MTSCSEDARTDDLGLRLLDSIVCGDSCQFKISLVEKSIREKLVRKLPTTEMWLGSGFPRTL